MVRHVLMTIHTARKSSDSVHEVLRVPEVPGFTPLYPVHPYSLLL